MWKLLLLNSRIWIVGISGIFSLVLFLGVSIVYPEGTLRTIRLTQLYGFTSIVLLYFTLLAGPVCYMFRSLPFRAEYFHARRALGVSAFYFGLLHSGNAFFRQLGGFAGLEFLSQTFLTGIIIGFIALSIFFCMALTSSDAMVKLLTFRRWKLLHRMVYGASFLVLLHVLMLGSHFSDLSGAIPALFFVCISFLLVLEGLRLDAFLLKRFNIAVRVGLGTTMMVAVCSAFFLLMVLPEGKNSPFGIHREHKKMSPNEPMAMNSESAMNSMPGMQGDPNKRYSVSFMHPDIVPVNEPVPLQFNVYDAVSGNRIILFQTPYEKPFHLIVVDKKLTYFRHIHPEFDQLRRLSIEHTFPESGAYNLYADFQPIGAREQQFAFSIVAGGQNEIPAFFQPDTSFVQDIDGYTVSLDFPQPLTAQLLNQGNAAFMVRVSDALTGEPITSLSPYLNAYGHFVMINTKTYEYSHVHPKIVLPPGTTKPGGPDIEFFPMSLYGSIHPGVYRIFIEVYPDGKQRVAIFTIEVQ